MGDQVDQKGDQGSNEEWEAVAYPVNTMGSISEECVIISSQVLSQEITSIVGGTKIDADLWECIKIVGSSHKSLGEMKPIEV